ncbi:MAG TPA: EAL domain-containing protein, partial [Rhodocyclaceae bacterium]|nr:EAL domain-containing protein [Rhodocyclaceae bacterium]
MRPPALLLALDLKARIAIFAVALFIGAVWLLAQDLDAEVRQNFQQVLSAQQFQTVSHVARNLDDAIVRRLNALTDAAALIDPAWMNRPDRLHQFLASQMPLQRFFNSGLLVISRQGIGLADLPDLEGREAAGYTDRDFFRDVMATGRPVVGAPTTGRFTHQPVINMGVPIRNGRNEIIGVLMGGNRIAASELFNDVVPARTADAGELHVISLKDGLFVTSTEPGRIMQPESPPGTSPMHDRYRQGFEGSGVAMNSRGSENLSSGKRVPSAGWLVVATLPTAVAFRPIAGLEGEIYKDAALASVAIAVLLWLFLQRQLSPLSRSAALIEAMAGEGESLRPLRLEGSKEIRRLLDSFNRLQQHILQQKKSLQDRAEQMRLAASVFEGTSEAILIASPDNRILSVNRAFCRLTGYEEAELIGRNPQLLQSGRHDPAFYREMWSSLGTMGHWQGEIWNRRKNGEVFPERLTISTLYDEDGRVVRYIAIAADITKQKQAEEVIWRQANFDLVTNLPNRRLLLERARQAIDRAGRQGRCLAVLHVDLDHFSEVNDTLGHPVGDQLIIEAGKRIASCLDADADLVAHLGGDEFVVLLGNLADASPRIERVTEDIRRLLAQAFPVGNETTYISASIGVTLYPKDAQDVAGLLANANQAKQVAKDEGRNCHRRFAPSMQAGAQLRLQLGNDMRGALAGRQFQVYYQPIVELATGRVVKAEALLRWHHPERGMVSPVQFIPIAEETGLIGEIGDWVFKEAAQLAKRWCSRCGYLDNGVCSRLAAGNGSAMACLYQVTVNMSPRQFYTGRTDKTWLGYLRENGIYPNCIAIEITEGLLLDRHAEVLEKLIAFRDVGIQVALDDFGTGYSAMSYLKKFDIDYLKIDRSFVGDIVTDPSDRAIAEAIIVMAHKLGLKVVAEG